VVILSANLTPEVKIESLKNGADAMIEKPFAMEFLQLRIENLITSRKKLIERISGNETYEGKDENVPLDGLSSRDIVFLRELNSTIEDNFTDPDFGVEELANHLNISRSSLNRKMRDILNTTANNYIRDKKIEKAEELLRTSSMQINEICYKVGFTTPSYFIKCFRKKYGMSPNEYANSNH
jgi:AraC-like DNA-binding protein